MSTRKMLLSILLLSSISLTSLAETSLEFHTDKDLDTATAQLISSDGSLLAEIEWNGPLPSGVNGTGTLASVPLRLLGLLRDSIATNMCSDAVNARAWLQSAMGSYFESPTASIPASAWAEIAIGPNGSSISWCGIRKNADKKCPFDCTPTQNNTVTCQGCGCRGTRTIF